MDKYTKKEHEQYLNELYFDSYTIDNAIEQLTYLGTDKIIENNYNKKTLGTLLRKKDIIAFNCSYNDKCR